MKTTWRPFAKRKRKRRGKTKWQCLLTLLKDERTASDIYFRLCWNLKCKISWRESFLKMMSMMKKVNTLFCSTYIYWQYFCLLFHSCVALLFSNCLFVSKSGNYPTLFLKRDTDFMWKLNASTLWTTKAAVSSLYFSPVYLLLSILALYENLNRFVLQAACWNLWWSPTWITSSSAIISTHIPSPFNDCVYSTAKSA